MDTLATISQQKMLAWSSPGAPSSSPAPQTLFILKSHLSLNTPGENKHSGHGCVFGLGFKTALSQQRRELSPCFIPRGKKAREKKKNPRGRRGKFKNLSPWSRETLEKRISKSIGRRFSLKKPRKIREITTRGREGIIKPRLSIITRRFPCPLRGPEGWTGAGRGHSRPDTHTPSSSRCPRSA